MKSTIMIIALLPGLAKAAAAYLPVLPATAALPTSRPSVVVPVFPVGQPIGLPAPAVSGAITPLAIGSSLPSPVAPLPVLPVSLEKTVIMAQTKVFPGIFPVNVPTVFPSARSIASAAQERRLPSLKTLNRLFDNASNDEEAWEPAPVKSDESGGNSGPYTLPEQDLIKEIGGN